MFFGSVVVSAQETDSSSVTCDVCNQTPAHLETYFRVMDDLLQLLPTQADEQSNNTIKDLAISARTDAEAIIVGTLVTTVTVYDTATSDIFADFKLMFGSSTVRRDRQKLLDYDYKISQRILDSGMR